jgi:hypothetical protein
MCVTEHDASQACKVRPSNPEGCVHCMLSGPTNVGAGSACVCIALYLPLSGPPDAVIAVHVCAMRATWPT